MGNSENHSQGLSRTRIRPQQVKESGRREEPESGCSEDQIHVPVSNSVRLQWGQESSPSQVKRQAIVRQRGHPTSQTMYLVSHVQVTE